MCAADDDDDDDDDGGSNNKNKMQCVPFNGSTNAQKKTTTIQIVGRTYFLPFDLQ